MPARSLGALLPATQPHLHAYRSENLFQSLEERTLTEEEQRIIDQRVRIRRCTSCMVFLVQDSSADFFSSQLVLNLFS